jgi:hypothetical protein
VRSPSGIILERIDPVPGQARRPDFRVLSPHGRADLGGLAANIEVKSPRDDLLDEMVEQAPQGVVVGHVRRDPAVDRIARHIKSAVGQFDAVNPDRVLPNILVEVNHADAGNYGDLGEAITGTRPAAESEENVVLVHAARCTTCGCRRADRLSSVTGVCWSDSMPAHRRALETVLSGLLRR